ncbi:MAG: enoyl-CoA hydratase-related protein, partial [Hydrogenophaga sp.]|uniref:enoyl-CoA hydratase-related protein n=2 Tax=unclassified Hydrogenophaga TaxID=2610897 RepID=UPI0040353F41
GPVRAQQWLMLSDPIDAAQCLAAGAVDQVFPAAELEAAAQALVQRLCASAPASLAAMKRLSLEGPALSLQAYLSLEQQLLKACARTADAREGTSAFVAKRAPTFTGR